MSATLLLVEDDESLRKSLISYLAQHGFPAEVASCLAEARRKVGEAKPDVIVLDWMLPDGEGVDFVQELRRKGCAIPVILLTARVELVDKVVGLESGANDYLTKPFEPRELVPSMGQVFQTETPTFAWKDFKSSLYQPNESRYRAANVYRVENPGLDAEWEDLEADPVRVEVTSGKLVRGRKYRFVLTYGETKHFGDVRLRRQMASYRLFSIAQ